MIVRAAHARGMAVLASLNLHEPRWTTVNPERGTVVAASSDHGVPLAGSADVLHLDYQRLVGERVQDLLRTDIDGLVVGARRAKGLSKEWSPVAMDV